MSLHALSHADRRGPADDAAQILLRAHFDARSYLPCVAAAPALVLPAALVTDADLRAAAALAVAESFGLLAPAQAAAAVRLVSDALDGAADAALDQASPDVVLAWCTAGAEWCERNGLDRPFSRLQARAVTADADPAAPAWARVHWRVAAAWHHEAFGRRDGVAAQLDEAAQIAAQADDIALKVVVWLKQARLSLSRSDPAAALVLAQRGAAHADATAAPLWLADIADVRSRAALVRGDMHRALHEARQAAGLADLARATPSYTMTYRLNEAYALLGLGAWDAAVAVVQELAAIVLPARLTERVELIASLITLVRDDRTGAWTAASRYRLGRCIRRQRELDWPGVLPVLPALIARLWARALDDGIEVDWVRASVRSRDLAPPEPAWPTAWPWAVRLSVVGPLSVMIDGRDPVFADAGKAGAKPLALLRRIALEGAYDGASADAIAESLWPGEGREGRGKALEITLARLRKLLGQADAVMLHDRRLRLNPRRVWLDSVALLRLLDAATHGQVMHWQQAAALWRGPLLAGEPDEPWLQAQRERWRRRLAAQLQPPAPAALRLHAGAVDPAMRPLLGA